MCLVADITSSVEAIQWLINERVEDVCEVENQLDAQHAAELNQLRSTNSQRLQTDLITSRDQIATDLRDRGYLLTYILVEYIFSIFS